MICKNCGTQLTGTENICPNCGSPIEKEEVAQEVAPIEENTETPAVVEQPDALQGETAVPSSMDVPAPEVAPIEENTEQPAMVEQPDAVQGEPVVPSSMNVSEPVDNSQPMVPPTPEVNMAQDTVMDNNQPETMNNNMMDNSMNNMAQVQAFSNSMNEPAQPQITTPTQQPVGQKGGNKTLILVLILITVLAIGAAAYFALFKNNGQEVTPTPTNNNTPTDNVSNDTTSTTTASFGGYKFEIPSGYEYMVEDEILVIYNNAIFYGMAVDYTNSYDAYKAELQKTYPDQINDIEKELNNRKYLLAQITNKDEEYKDYSVIQFVTPGSDSESFIGLIVKKDGTQPVLNEYNVLTNILNKAQKEGSSFAPGGTQDAGKNGIKIYTPSKGVIKFSE